MKIEKRYLLIPYNTHMTPKTLLFYKDGALINEISIKIDCHTPEYYAYCDMQQYIGDEIKLSCIVEGRALEVKDANENFDDGIYIEQADEIDEKKAKDKRYRPFLHFTPERGWLSDPDGLIYFNGLYHIFYQHNPYCCEWGNIHWGHAVSRDLFHWEYMPAVLTPDEFGMPFSGCAVSNAGAKSGTSDKIYLFYTAAGGTTSMSEGREFTICMAVSENGGETFKKYGKNPVLANVCSLNRDPKIAYCEEGGCYIMALYLKDSRFAVLSSENLYDWRMEQTLEIPGDAECPDIYKLYLDGDNEKPYWIFSGSSDMYFVGRFEFGAEENGERPRIHFVSAQPAKKLHYGTCSYAAQSFFGLKTGTVKRMSWLSGTHEVSEFNGQLSVPMDMSLKTIKQEMYLCAEPAEEIFAQKKTGQKYTNVNVSPDKPFLQYYGLSENQSLYSGIYLNIEAPFIKDCIITVSILGIKITVNMAKNLLECCGVTAPLSVGRSIMKIKAIIDKRSAEIFIDEGEFFLSCVVSCDYHLNSMEISSDRHISFRRIEILSIR